MNLRAAQSIEEAVKKALCLASPNKDLPSNIRNEICDMLNHQSMIFGKELTEREQEILNRFVKKLVGE